LARNRESKIELTAYDDLFETDESRAEANLSKIREIPIAEIDEFPDHPFKVLMDEDMEQLVDSIRRSGVMTPATVRQKEDGRYELISGHRRKKACELAGLETLKCEVKELTRDEAIIVMVESNLQRTTILPSEKAFAYKMRLEAMKRQGQRTDLTCSPVGNKLQGVKSSDELAEKVGESKNQIFRYIRLTELVPEILQMVDEDCFPSCGGNLLSFRGTAVHAFRSDGLQRCHALSRTGYQDEKVHAGGKAHGRGYPEHHAGGKTEPEREARL
jgi:ParB family chromosome partitioning protein